MVLIESDWNLKAVPNCLLRNQCLFVLIESDWNLKLKSMNQVPLWEIRINRIRLEFKAHNRDAWRTRQQVLIESDWNLKYYGKCLGNGL